jgi:putative transposase
MIQSCDFREEWKTENQLQKLAEKYPSRYQRTEDGQWRCPPGEAHARPMGLSYRVRSSAELQPVFIQNLMFLEDYCGFKADIPTQIQTILLNRVRIQPGITIAAVLTSEPEVRANDIYAMIATEQLYADLNAAPLAEHWRVQLYLDRQDYYYLAFLAAPLLPSSMHRCSS